MAYRRSTRTTRATRAAPRARRAVSRYRAAPRKAASRSRAAPKRRAAASPRTIRIVIEAPQNLSAASRPDQLVQKVEAPKKAKF
jgi:hypothetical protein